MNKKTQQIGVLSVDDQGRERIQFGSTKNKDPKYNYTIELRIFNSEGREVLKKTNPRITLWDPRDGSPDWLKKNLTVDIVDFVPQSKTATEQLEEGI
jgi:hypothetical protein